MFRNFSGIADVLLLLVTSVLLSKHSPEKHSVWSNGLLPVVEGFVPINRHRNDLRVQSKSLSVRRKPKQLTNILLSTSSTEKEDAVDDDSTDEDDISKMRLGEITSELKTRGIAYDDCFDRESLVKRLIDARQGKVLPQEDEKNEEDESTTSPPSQGDDSAAEDSPDTVVADQEVEEVKTEPAEQQQPSTTTTMKIGTTSFWMRMM